MANQNIELIVDVLRYTWDRFGRTATREAWEAYKRGLLAQLKVSDEEREALLAWVFDNHDA